MSTSYQGAYSSDVFDPSKRYRIGTAYGMGDVGGFQKDSVISDAELREIQMVSDSFIRQLVNGNFLNGSSINDGFKIVESTSPSNNFKITGGDGTVNEVGKALIGTDKVLGIVPRGYAQPVELHLPASLRELERHRTRLRKPFAFHGPIPATVHLRRPETRIARAGPGPLRDRNWRVSVIGREPCCQAGTLADRS